MKGREKEKMDVGEGNGRRMTIGNRGLPTAASDNSLKTIESSLSATHASCSLRKPPPSDDRKPTQPRRVTSSSRGSSPSLTLKDLYASSTSSTVQSSQSTLSSSIYSSMQLPTGCLREHDGCDEAELLARAKRCQEIMRLSQQATEAEAERVRVANIKPLIWAKPTFELGPSTAAAAVSDTTAAEETQAASLGKRKERQEEAKLPQNTSRRITLTDCFATQDASQKCKRLSTLPTSGFHQLNSETEIKDDDKEEKEEGPKGDDATSS